jgi:hypothetical protein
MIAILGMTNGFANIMIRFASSVKCSDNSIATCFLQYLNKRFVTVHKILVKFE